MAIITHQHDYKNGHSNPTTVARAQSMANQAWQNVEQFFEAEQYETNLERYFAACLVDDFKMRRYYLWQIEGGQSNWSPLDRIDPRKQVAQ